MSEPLSNDEVNALLSQMVWETDPSFAASTSLQLVGLEPIINLIPASFDWTPSPQQLAIFDCCRQMAIDMAQVSEAQLHLRCLFINALAGTGKTTTLLRAISEGLPGSVWFGAFGKPIAQEINRKLNPIRAARVQRGIHGDVDCSTVHSVGWQSLSRYMRIMGLGELVVEDRNRKYQRIVEDLLFEPLGPSKKPWERRVHEGMMPDKRMVDAAGGTEVVSWLVDMGMQWGIGLALAGESWSWGGADSNGAYSNGDYQRGSAIFAAGTGQGGPSGVQWSRWEAVLNHYGVSFGGTLSGRGTTKGFTAQAITKCVIKLAHQARLQGIYSFLEKIGEYGPPTASHTDLIYLPLWLQDRFGSKVLELPAYDWVIGDEGQDFNKIRVEMLLRMMQPGNGKLVVVGDKHQAIYGFTGADAHAIENAQATIQSQSAIEDLGPIAARAILADPDGGDQLFLPKVLPLLITRRCPKVICRKAQKWAPEFEAAPDAIEGTELRLSAAEFYASVNAYPDRWRSSAGNTGILCRLNAPLVKVFYKLMLAGVPARIEGKEIGAQLQAFVRKWTSVQTIGDFVDRLAKWLAHEKEKAQPGTGKGSRRRNELALAEDQAECLKAVLTGMLIRTNRENEDWTGIPIAELYQEVDRLFSDAVDLAAAGRRPDQITLSSFHKAKGLEWELVVLWGIAQLCPAPWATKEWEREQEEWLQYVAWTRTKDTVWQVDIKSKRLDAWEQDGDGK